MPERHLDLAAYIDACPSPYHAVAESVRRLQAAGFRPVDEGDRWHLEPGARGYVIRKHGSLAAFEVGSASPAEAGFRILGAHTDSPTLRIKPRPERRSCGYRQLAVEPYGGVLLHTWLDRDLSLAGRVGVLRDGKPQTVLVDLARPLLHIPNLAIHLQREIREEGLKLNPQEHLAPILGLPSSAELATLVAERVGDDTGVACLPSDVVSYDLMTYDTARASIGGAGGEFLSAGRIDNLASCHAATSALVDACSVPAACTRAIVLYHHEEVGSRSAEGAGGPFLEQTMARIVSSYGGDADAQARALSRSHLISIDMAHAVHPNYPSRHDPDHQPVIGGGPVIKSNASLAYASDAETVAMFVSLCRRLSIEPQFFVSRNDMPCGTTIGPISAARVGLGTVDVGNPMLAMHSAREIAGTADVGPMINLLGAFLAAR